MDNHYFLCIRMAEIAVPKMHAYYGDLIHDAFFLANSKDNEFLWAFCGSGTALFPLPLSESHTELAAQTYSDFYFIRVRKRDTSGYAYGDLIRLNVDSTLCVPEKVGQITRELASRFA